VARFVPLLTVAALLIGCGDTRAAQTIDPALFTATGKTTDEQGVDHYTVTSTATQTEPVELRVYRPDGWDGRRILYVLPVAKHSVEEPLYGDGLTLVRQSGKADDMLIVAPDFTWGSWYADDLEGPRHRDEMFMVQGVVPFVDQAYKAAKAPQRLLMGFSKSGWGALSMLLRKPWKWTAAVASDAPLKKTAPDQFNMPDAFDTQGNFQAHQVSRLWTKKVYEYRGKPARIGLINGSYWRKQMSAARDDLKRLGVPFTYNDMGKTAGHNWTNGWVPKALDALTAMADAAAGA
jgi:hypothetical protein